MSADQDGVKEKVENFVMLTRPTSDFMTEIHNDGPNQTSNTIILT